VHWKVDIGMMLFFVVFLLPLYQVYSFLGSWRRSWRPWTTVGVAVVLYGFYLYGFWLLGEAFPITSAKHGTPKCTEVQCRALLTCHGGRLAVLRGSTITSVDLCRGALYQPRRCAGRHRHGVFVRLWRRQWALHLSQRFRSVRSTGHNIGLLRKS